MAVSIKIRWWQWLPFQRWRIVGAVESADDIPDRLPHNAAVLVSSAGYDKWIAFDCPCAQRHRIMLNLDASRYPNWRMHQKDHGPLTLSPSVNYYDGVRRCHFFIRGGKVDWAKDTFS